MSSEKYMTNLSKYPRKIQGLFRFLDSAGETSLFFSFSVKKYIAGRAHKPAHPKRQKFKTLIVIQK